MKGTKFLNQAFIFLQNLEFIYCISSYLMIASSTVLIFNIINLKLPRLYRSYYILLILILYLLKEKRRKSKQKMFCCAKG